MIFVTVGTHEQPFDRLLKCIDKMVEDKLINEEVIIQKGYTEYEPKHCKSYKLIGYEEMQQYVEEARIVITHGGPASFLSALAVGKIPIVVPRKKDFNEHVNNHQLEFAREVELRMKNIILAETEEKIIDSIVNYEKKCKEINNRVIIKNNDFINKFNKEIRIIFGEQDDT